MKKLYLIPSPISDDVIKTIPKYVLDIIRSLDCFFAENAKTARRFIKQCNHPKSLNSLLIEQINKHNATESELLFKDLLTTQSEIGLLSEAGCPAVADPGSIFVEIARKSDFQIIPLVGPNSIILALMVSGLNGQNFSFHGYLPNKSNALNKKVKVLETEILKSRTAHIFIETPYRNKKLFDLLIQKLHQNIKLSIAMDLTGPYEFVDCKTIAKWKSTPLQWKKLPCIFILGI